MTQSGLTGRLLDEATYNREEAASDDNAIGATASSAD
jgi:hypothetical protein